METKTNIYREYPITVLINKNSASASEILAGCLLESYGAEVIGVNSGPTCFLETSSTPPLIA